jgi:phospholipid/cholesterol/gamma-HCH transport system substrate-binding protein
VKRSIRSHLGHFLAIAGLVVLAAVTAVYILSHQRFRFPLIQPARFELKAEFSTAQAVMPGQGQTVRVSGVRIGDISSVALRGGRAVVTMKLDPQYHDLVHTDATALLRPKTGLKDMFIELYPGSRHARLVREGFAIPISNTEPDVNADELLSMLDADTRDYLRLLVQGAGQGLSARGSDLAQIYRRFEPTHRDLARVTASVARRRHELRQLVGALRQLTGELATKNRRLAELVQASAGVFRAFASEDHQVSASVGLLPAALRQTTATLERVQAFATQLRPAAVDLRPAVRELARADAALLPLAREATPILASSIRPFVREARPVVRLLTPSATDVATSAPDVTASGTIVNRLLNMLAFNQGGRQGPDVAGRDQGYLFWLAWLDHDGTAVFSTADAHGPFRAGANEGTCGSLQGLAQALGQGNPLVGIGLFGLQGAFTDPRVCGSQPLAPAFARRVFGHGTR